MTTGLPRGEADPVPPLSEEEVRRIFARLESAVKEDEAEFVLIGGQAVALWSLRYLDAERDAEAERVLTSKDIDFLGDTRILKYCAILLGGEALITPIDHANSPNSGAIVFEDSEGNRRTLDFLISPAGLTKADVLETAQLLEIPEGPQGEPAFHLWVIHPERLLESRVANLALPGKTTPLALDQLTASVKCAREFAVALLDSTEIESGKAIRAVLNHNERIFRLACGEMGTLALEHGVDVADAIVVDSRLPEKFLNVRFPQMQEKLKRGK